MKKTLAVVALVVACLTTGPALTTVRAAGVHALPAPPIEPVCIMIWGKVICF